MARSYVRCIEFCVSLEVTSSTQEITPHDYLAIANSSLGNILSPRVFLATHGSSRTGLPGLPHLRGSLRIRLHHDASNPPAGKTAQHAVDATDAFQSALTAMAPLGNWSLANQSQNSSTPSRCKSKSDNEGQSGYPLGKCVLAPSLEHRHQSNEKHRHRNCRKGPDPHRHLGGDMLVFRR